jgi:glycerophosphoryl diester phosphodiesterase
MLIDDFDNTGVDEQLKALGFTPDIYSPAFVHVNEKLVQLCHQQNMKIIPWTVNDKAKIEELKKIGVDGIITDYPNLFNE